ncbi:PIN domain-containing protein [Candidatus Woesearchaeota archaeon]|nr:PIN domain-containing protein [Candidatus Woesearchaeota archaeon]
MIIVIDANIIIAALLGSRGKIAILTSYNPRFYAPSFVIDEIKKYKQQICAKMNWTFEEFNIYLEALLVFITLIDYEDYERYLEKSLSAIKQRDVKDADYIACSLLISADFILTEDKDFSEQKLVGIKTTAQFIDENK